jgi:hypothetical protein
MPTQEFFEPALGPQGIQQHGLTPSLLSPADTNDTTNVLAQDAPGKFVRTGTTGLGKAIARCAANDIPDFVIVARQPRANQPTAVLILPNMGLANQPPTGAFVLKLKFTGTAATGTDLGVAADGAGGWKVVAGTAGIGKVIALDGVYAYVLF